MNPDWQIFLQRQHAQLENGAVLNFGSAQDELAAAGSGTVLCDLSHFGELKVSGEEAQGFLYNLLSSDIKALSPNLAQLSSFNTPKGRMLATFLVWQRGADYYLHLPRDLGEAIRKKLSMYVLRSKVKIEDASADTVCLGLAGKDAGSLLQEHFGSVPETDFSVDQHDDACVIRLDSQRYLIAAMPEHAPALWQNFSGKARAAGTACWDWFNIRAGMPVVLPATQEQFVPQMANLELIGGVSFKKGCYPGQEIVARMQYLGKAKRRMYLAHIAGSAQAGDHLYSAGTEDGQACGMVANAAPAPGGGYDLLAVMQISSHETQAVHLGSMQGEKLEFLPLPYSIPA